MSKSFWPFNVVTCGNQDLGAKNRITNMLRMRTNATDKYMCIRHCYLSSKRMRRGNMKTTTITPRNAVQIPSNACKYFRKTNGSPLLDQDSATAATYKTTLIDIIRFLKLWADEMKEKSKTRKTYTLRIYFSICFLLVPILEWIISQ